MFEQFTKNDAIDKKDNEFYEVYILYFDESKGPIPLFIYPDESLKKDSEKMRLINIHPIWFLDIKEHEDFNRIDLEYNGKMYFARKFLVDSNRVKRRAGFKQDTPETIILIISLSTDIDIFGSALINKMADVIITNFQEKLYYIIESEIFKFEIVKTQKINKIIQKGDILKEKLRKLIIITCKEFFESTIEQTDAMSIKLQKAFSYFMLKRINISKIFNHKIEQQFPDKILFDSIKNDIRTFQFKAPIEISNIEFAQNNREIEIKVENRFGKSMCDLRIRINYIKEFFEKEVFNEKIKLWLPEEEILLISPIVPGINDYLFYIIDDINKEILFTRKIELDK